MKQIEWEPRVIHTQSNDTSEASCNKYLNILKPKTYAQAEN